MAESSKGGRRLVRTHVRRHKKKGMPQSQAVAAALSEARRKGRRVSPRRRGKGMPKRGARSMRKEAPRKAGSKRKGGKGKGGRKEKR